MLKKGVKLLKTAIKSLFDFSEFVDDSIPVIQRGLTEVSYDPIHLCRKMVRKANINGEEVKFTVKTFSDGITKTTVSGDSFQTITRVKTITKNIGNSSSNTKRISIRKQDSEGWLKIRDSILTKDYSKDGILNVKILSQTDNVSKNSIINRISIQERTINHPINSSTVGMLPNI